MRIIKRTGGGFLVLDKEKAFIVIQEKEIHDVLDATKFVEKVGKQGTC